MNFLSKTRLVVIGMVGTVMLAQGCASTDQYHWGEYEDMVYASFHPNDESDPETQVQILTAEIDKAQASGKKVAPGVHAHLGYMQHLSGKDSEAEASFQKELELYPSSKVFIERLLSSLTGKASKTERIN